MELIGKRIRQCRLMLGMPQEELAGKEMTKSFISQVERGEAVPSVRALRVLAKRLGQCPGYFLVVECPVNQDGATAQDRRSLVKRNGHQVRGDIYGFSAAIGAASI